MNVKIKINDADIEVINALTKSINGSDPILDRPITGQFSLPDIIQEVKRHYLTKALAEHNGNMKKASQALGLTSAQTMKNWCMINGVKF